MGKKKSRGMFGPGPVCRLPTVLQVQQAASLVLAP